MDCHLQIAENSWNGISSTPTTLKVIYKTRATAVGGRSAQSQLDDG